VIYKMDRELDWISVIVPKDYQNSLSNEIIKWNKNYFDNFGLDDLYKIGHSDACETKAYVKTITLFEGRKNDLYLPFRKTNPDTKPYAWKESDQKKQLFMRNVLI